MNRKLGELAALGLALCLLTGCSALLERTYSTAEPHSSKFWESEAAGTLRAETYQDVVNDLLLLIGQHRETATLRLYDFESDIAVADTLERATTEVQQETPLGAYAVEYITSSSHVQRGYYEVAVRIGYRRTLEQLQAVVNATSPEALYSLLSDALDQEKTELAVRMGYWGPDGETRVGDAIAQLREERELTETVPWVVSYYPAGENPGLIEVLLDPPEPEAGTLPEEGEEGNSPEGEAQDGESQDGESQNGESQNGESQNGESQNGESQGGEPQEGGASSGAEAGEAPPQSAEPPAGEKPGQSAKPENPAPSETPPAPPPETGQPSETEPAEGGGDAGSKEPEAGGEAAANPEPKPEARSAGR